MENKEFVEELEIQRKVVEALKGDTVGKSIKGLQLMVKEKDFERFKAILIKMVERGELISREHTLTLPLEAPIDTKQEEVVTPPLVELPPKPILQKIPKERKIELAMEFIAQSGKPVSEGEILKGVVSENLFPLYVILQALVKDGKLVKQTISGERSNNCFYSLPPMVIPPRNPNVFIHKGKPRVIRETRELLFRENDVPDESLHGRIAPNMDAEKYWTWVVNNIYTGYGSRLTEDGTWRKTGVETPYHFFEENYTDAGLTLEYRIPDMLDAIVKQFKEEWRNVDAILSDIEEYSVKEFLFQVDILSAIAENMKKGHEWIRLMDVKQVTYDEMVKSGDSPFIPPYWVWGILEQSMDAIVEADNEMRKAKDAAYKAKCEEGKANRKVDKLMDTLNEGIRGILESVKAAG